jgi:hypothetical protein
MRFLSISMFVQFFLFQIESGFGLLGTAGPTSCWPDTTRLTMTGSCLGFGSGPACQHSMARPTKHVMPGSYVQGPSWTGFVLGWPGMTRWPGISACDAVVWDSLRLSWSTCRDKHNTERRCADNRSASLCMDMCVHLSYVYVTVWSIDQRVRGGLSSDEQSSLLRVAPACSSAGRQPADRNELRPLFGRALLAHEK